MRIRHKESNSYYEVMEAEGSYTLIDPQASTTYTFDTCSDVLWKAIELVRRSNIDSLSSEEVSAIAKQTKITEAEVQKLLPTVVISDINKTYYDRLFMKMLANYKMRADEFVLSNKTNFYLKDEVGYLLRKRSGMLLRLSMILA